MLATYIFLLGAEEREGGSACEEEKWGETSWGKAGVAERDVQIDFPVLCDVAPKDACMLLSSCSSLCCKR